jgi:Bacterial Ig-like domain (group 1)
MRAPFLALVGLLGLSQLTCNQAILTAPPGSTLTLFANPEFIPASGGRSTISALAIEPAGTPVADGTVVQFFTNLGSIDAQGKTNDGVARVTLVADSRSGTATVSAFSGGPAVAASPGTGTSGGGSATVTVVIGSALPSRVQVTADPVRIAPDGPRESLIRAFVVDANGNPVAHVPVVFSVTQPAGASPTESLDSAGAPVYTDNSGVAEDTLSTRYDPTDAAKTVTVAAVAAFDPSKNGSVSVTIN